jgi:hypothetical protein
MLMVNAAIPLFYKTVVRDNRERFVPLCFFRRNPTVDMRYPKIGTGITRVGHFVLYYPRETVLTFLMLRLTSTSRSSEQKDLDRRRTNPVPLFRLDRPHPSGRVPFGRQPSGDRSDRQIWLSTEKLASAASQGPHGLLPSRRIKRVLGQIGAI